MPLGLGSKAHRRRWNCAGQLLCSGMWSGRGSRARRSCISRGCPFLTARTTGPCLGAPAVAAHQRWGSVACGGGSTPRFSERNPPLLASLRAASLSPRPADHRARAAHAGLALIPLSFPPASWPSPPNHGPPCGGSQLLHPLDPLLPARQQSVSDQVPPRTAGGRAHGQPGLPRLQQQNPGGVRPRLSAPGRRCWGPSTPRRTRDSGVWSSADGVRLRAGPAGLGTWAGAGGPSCARFFRGTGGADCIRAGVPPAG